MDNLHKVLPAPVQLSLQTRGDFRRSAVELLGQMPEGTGALVVDLSATTFVDSAGLGTLVMVRRHAATRKQTVRLRGASDQIRLLLSLTKLEGVFDWEDARSA